MGILDYFNRSPFRQRVGIEITTAADGYAEGRLPLRDHHSSNRNRMIAQGGVTFTLADSVGGAAAVSLVGSPTPTIDFRIDYLNPATDDLFATGEVIRHGGETAVVSVDVENADGDRIATGQGVYKTSNLPEDAPWDIDQDG